MFGLARMQHRHAALLGCNAKRQAACLFRTSTHRGISAKDSASSASTSQHAQGSEAHAIPTQKQDPQQQHNQNQNYPIESAGLSPHQLQQLHTYLDYMLEVNKVMNLTAVRDPEEAWQRHIGDSLALLPIIDKHVKSLLTAQPKGPAGTTTQGQKQGKRGVAQAGRAATQVEHPGNAAEAHGSGASSSSSSSESIALRVIDVGTGAGLPGMVLAAARPHWKVTLLDSLRKRCDFLTQAAERAGISNVTVVWSRAEDAGQNPELREVHDLAVARAVAETRILAELCLPFVRVGGLWVAPKGPSPQAEVQAAGPAIKKVGGHLVALEMVQSFSVDGQRTAVVAAKVAPTPPKFPRRPGTPNTQPL